MNDAPTLIASLGRDGKTPLEIAAELHARGLTDRRGKAIGPAVVEGILRFAGIGPGAFPRETVKGAVWGEAAESTFSVGEVDETVPEKKRKNRWNPGGNISDSLKAEITRLYQQENMKVGDIAAKLGVHVRRLNAFCAHLAGFSVPPGEITEFTDRDGRRITRYPPGYARGVHPQRNVRPTQGGW